jgi:hypothetical protein
LGAAAVYKSCNQIPIGELYQELAAPFLDGDPNALVDLVSLPFCSVFTTNYDRTLHNAFSKLKGISPLTVELGDLTMRNAPWNENFYIARVHGRVEEPTTIVLAETDYAKISADPCYVDFIRHVLTRHSCIFIGFSFIDPAISFIFRDIEERLSPAFPSIHLALLSSDADTKLASQLARLNIKSAYYDSKNNHADLWNAIRRARHESGTFKSMAGAKSFFPHENIKRFLGTAYARTKLEKEIGPLRDSIVDGIILDYLEKQKNRSFLIADIPKELKRILSLTEAMSIQLTKQRIDSLCGRGWCRVSNGRLYLTKDISNVLGNDIKLLAEAIEARLHVREGIQKTSEYKAILQALVEEVLIARSWDLGAHYAGAISGEVPNVMGSISSFLDKNCSDKPASIREALGRAAYDLFQSPDEAESRLLSELGRAAFALNLVIVNPCATIAYQIVLPDKIYLDATFIMPALVKGHPFHNLYWQALERLRQEANKEGIQLDIFVGEVFLNEIIAHRELAKQAFEYLGLDNPDVLTNHIMYRGAENTNIFIGAYANWLFGSKESISFDRFLKLNAPYGTETDLSNYLERMGIKTVKFRFSAPSEVTLFCSINSALQEAYRNDPRHKFDPKEDILIEHESKQLAQLSIDIDRKSRPIFVSADIRLRKLSRGQVLVRAGNSIITNRAFLQLVDLLIGLGSEPVVLSKLIWGGGAQDDEVLIRNYLIHQALQYKDQAMAKSIPEVLQDTIREGLDLARKEKVQLFPGGALDEELRRTRLIDTIEDHFYKRMGEVIDKKFPQEYNYAKKARLELAKRNLERTATLINKIEIKIAESKDKKEIAHLKEQLGNLYRNKEIYRVQLDELDK